MTTLFDKICSVLSGEYFRRRARKRAEKRAEQERAAREREREREAAAERAVTERAARRREERRRELAEREAQREAAVAAEKEAAQQKIASMAAYLKRQEEISHRGPDDRPKVTPPEATHTSKSQKASLRQLLQQRIFRQDGIAPAKDGAKVDLSVLFVSSMASTLHRCHFTRTPNQSLQPTASRRDAQI